MRIRDVIVKRKYYILLTILSFVSGVIVGYLLSNSSTDSNLATWIGGGLTVSFTFNVSWGILKEVMQHTKEEKTKKQKVKTKLNNEVFKKWENVSGAPYRFNIKIKIEIDQYLFEKARELLNDESNQTREILELWNQIDENIEKSLVLKYNQIGTKVKEKIIKTIHEAYPSLQEIKNASLVKAHDDCYVTNNIIGFVESSLKPKYLKNEPVNWEKILDKQFYPDIAPAIWSLNCYGVCIQSKNENNVNKKRFQKMIESLIKSILHDLKQLNELQEKIDNTLKDFKEKMHRLTIDIDLPIG